MMSVQPDPETATAAGCGEPWHDLAAELVIDRGDVKCWIEVVRPGEARPLHTHRHPWVTIVLSGAEAESFDAFGRLVSRRKLDAGQVTYNDRPEAAMTHRIRNVTEDRTLRMVAVELRDTDRHGGLS
jgi:hypothetical protein